MPCSQHITTVELLHRLCVESPVTTSYTVANDRRLIHPHRHWHIRIISSLQTEQCCQRRRQAMSRALLHLHLFILTTLSWNSQTERYSHCPGPRPLLLLWILCRTFSAGLALLQLRGGLGPSTISSSWIREWTSQEARWRLYASCLVSRFHAAPVPESLTSSGLVSFHAYTRSSRRDERIWTAVRRFRKVIMNTQPVLWPVEHAIPPSILLSKKSASSPQYPRVRCTKCI